MTTSRAGETFEQRARDPSNVCFPHGTGTMHHFFFLRCKSDGGHGRYCGRKIFACHQSFAAVTRVQQMFVDYLRTKYGDPVAHCWCRDFWTGERGRVCLAHSRYTVCNSNMGNEVSWRGINILQQLSLPCSVHRRTVLVHPPPARRGAYATPVYRVRCFHS